ncbi:MAG: 16S rRNA processing protein RimM [Deltaproteobacteria bacterium]|nr:16S rRNA processing protein RimM [Deltaproteobacteria bacterium]
MIALGRVERSVGLRGEVRIRLYNPESRTLADATRVSLRRAPRDGPAGADPSEPMTREARITRARYVSGAVVVAFEGVADRDAADAMRGLEVCVARDALPALEEGEHYHVDLVGLEARDETGERLGVVLDVIPYPSVDALVVRADDGRVAELPMVADLVISVSMEARVVTLEARSVAELMEPPARPGRANPPPHARGGRGGGGRR